MLESCRNAQERWGGVHLLIDRWLQERHALIQVFDGLKGDETALSRPALQRFCQLHLPGGGSRFLFRHFLPGHRTFLVVPDC